MALTELPPSEPRMQTPGVFAPPSDVTVDGQPAYGPRPPGELPAWMRESAGIWSPVNIPTDGAPMIWGSTFGGWGWLNINLPRVLTVLATRLNMMKRWFSGFERALRDLACRVEKLESRPATVVVNGDLVVKSDVCIAGDLVVNGEVLCGCDNCRQKRGC